MGVDRLDVGVTRATQNGVDHAPGIGRGRVCNNQQLAGIAHGGGVLKLSYQRPVADWYDRVPYETATGTKFTMSGVQLIG